MSKFHDWVMSFNPTQYFPFDGTHHYAFTYETWLLWRRKRTYLDGSLIKQEWSWRWTRGER